VLQIKKDDKEGGLAMNHRSCIALILLLLLFSTVFAQQVLWIRQFGSEEVEYALGVAVDTIGNVYIVGLTGGALPGQTNVGGLDAFVRKYDAAGNEVWTRQFGSVALDFAQGVAVDIAGNVYVAGRTAGALTDQPSAGGLDAFVRKYSAVGDELWTRQFGSTANDTALGVAVDANGNVYITGETYGALPGQTHAGGVGSDAFIRKYDAAGNELWTRQFGSTAHDGARDAVIDAAGNLYVTGWSWAPLPNQTLVGRVDVYLRKYDATWGIELWTRQFDSAAWDVPYAIALDTAGNVYIAGETEGAFLGQTHTGNRDAFVCKFDTAGNLLWVNQFGSTAHDQAYGVGVDAESNIYVAGWTEGTLPNQKRMGSSDAFARKYNADGRELWTYQFGSSRYDEIRGAAIEAAGLLYVVGRTEGALPGQTRIGGGDAFVAKLK
jgi:hypothetical protein